MCKKINSRLASKFSKQKLPSVKTVHFLLVFDFHSGAVCMIIIFDKSPEVSSCWRATPGRQGFPSGFGKKTGLFYILDMFISGTLKHISGANIKSSVWQEGMLTSNRSHMIYVRYNLFDAMENCSKGIKRL